MHAKPQPRIPASGTAAPSGGPFDLDDEQAYQSWREYKLAHYPRRWEDVCVEVRDPRRLSAAEQEAIVERCRRANMAVYVSALAGLEDKAIPALLGRRFGLQHMDHNMGADEDSITSITVVEEGSRGEYIPYTDRPIHWHTDGYYNALDRQIHGFILHCVRPAAQGGENALLDHELAYLLLRDENPDFIRVLCAADAMTVPANVQNGQVLRPQRSGPVFAIYPDGHLHMRYTMRARNILWKEDPRLQAAVKFLETLLRSDLPYILRTQLQAGWGLIGNNVLHDRSRFHNDPSAPRLLYRGRYYDRIAGT